MRIKLFSNIVRMREVLMITKYYIIQQIQNKILVFFSKPKKNGVILPPPIKPVKSVRIKIHNQHYPKQKLYRSKWR